MLMFGGKAKMARLRSTRSTGAGTIGHLIQKKKPRIPTAGLPRRCAIILLSIPTLKKAKAFRSAPSFSAVAAAILCHWFMRRSIGLRVFISAPPWPQRQQQPRRALSAKSVAIRWRCCLSADTTSAIISSIGSTSENVSPIRLSSST